ncbi:MAG TPA: hypothetical protein VJP80_07950 [Candidatus Saccharimonadales bacterium]|nr:hypothetical protein [Candidatus Saccharimonadales bacterium]
MRYFLGFLAAIGLIIVVFVLILKGFSSHGTPKNQINLLDYANSQTQVQLTVDGQINADSKHNTYTVTVGRDTVNMTTTQGYQGTVLQQKTYPNNSSAYAEFLRSLQLFGFVKGNTDQTKADERGYCPSGDRYLFEIISGGDTVQRFWSSSCGGGTYGGNRSQTLLLFQRQVPDYSALVTGLNL